MKSVFLFKHSRYYGNYIFYCNVCTEGIVDEFTLGSSIHKGWMVLICVPFTSIGDPTKLLYFFSTPAWKRIAIQVAKRITDYQEILSFILWLCWKPSSLPNQKRNTSRAKCEYLYVGQLRGWEWCTFKISSTHAMGFGSRELLQPQKFFMEKSQEWEIIFPILTKKLNMYLFRPCALSSSRVDYIIL